MKPARAWVLLPSGRRLNLILTRPPGPTATSPLACRGPTAGPVTRVGSCRSPSPNTASRRWRMRRSTGMLSAAEARRELLHDSTEALLGGWDPITPLKPHLGDVFNRVRRVAADGDRPTLQLPAWDNASHNKHTAADRLAAASEAFHVVGWPRETMRDDLEILFDPRERGPACGNTRLRAQGTLAEQHARPRLDPRRASRRPPSMSDLFERADASAKSRRGQDGAHPGHRRCRHRQDKDPHGNGRPPYCIPPRCVPTACSPPRSPIRRPPR